MADVNQQVVGVVAGGQVTETPVEPKQPVKITIILPTNAYFLSGIRDFTLTMTKNMTGFSEQWAYRFQSVVDELCNNAIEHGSEKGKDVKITFVNVQGESLEVIIEDTGTGASKYTAEQMNNLVKERISMMHDQYLGLRGRGLPKIVAEWTDELLFEDIEGGGLRVRVKKYLRDKENQVLSAGQNDPTHVVLK